jgi:hypothetical protein
MRHLFRGRALREDFSADFRSTILTAGLSVCILSSSLAQVSVTTQRYDNARSGLNLSESLLTPAKLNTATFGKLFSQPVDGAIVGHPLVLPNVTIPGLGRHNVVYVATMHDSVYAFDAASNTGRASQPLWKTSFTNPTQGITSVPIADQACPKVNAFSEVGVVPAMVIDPVSGTLYVLAKTEENGSFVHRLHALDITNGLEKFGGPVQITGSVVSGGVTFTFQDQFQISRPGLVLANGVVYATFAGLGCKYSVNAVGWMMAYNASNLQQQPPLGVFTANPKDGYGVGLWQAGVAPAVDSLGNLYVATGDGPFDADTGGPHYGDSVLKLNSGSSLGVADFFTPYNQAYLNLNDLDLGSGGVVLLPDQPQPHPHEMIVIGKEGSIYVIDRDSLGKFNAGGNSQIPQFLPFATGEVDGVPLYWNNMLFVAGQNFPVQAYLLTNGSLSAAPIYYASLVFPNPVGLVLSAQGNNNPVLWAMDGQGAATRMYAFDALSLNKLYSTADLSRDAIGGAPHFVTPVVANGRVYVGGTSKLTVYGLFRSLPIISGNAQTGTVNTALPTALKIQATDPYGGSVTGLSITFSDAAAGGSFNPAVVQTDSSGFASTIYTLPKIAKAVTITASSSGFNSATFSETAQAGAPTLVKTHSGYNQTAPVNTPLPAQISAAVKDAFNNAVPGVTVSFSDGGAGGILPPTAITDSSGYANVSYTTPPVAGVVYITASVSGVSAVATFKETVTAQ